MHQIKLQLFAGAALMLLGAAPAAATIVVNGSFETGDFTGWTQVNDTSFSFVTDEIAGGGPTDGIYHAAFGPTDPGGGGITQDLVTVAGAEYEISFDLANLAGPPNAFGLFWDGGFVSIDFDVEPFDYESFTTTLVASTNLTTLGFIFYHEPSFWLLDDVSAVAAGGGVVPEPATWAMFIAGFGVIGFMARRRRALAQS